MLWTWTLIYLQHNYATITSYIFYSLKIGSALTWNYCLVAFSNKPKENLLGYEGWSNPMTFIFYVVNVSACKKRYERFHSVMFTVVTTIKSSQILTFKTAMSLKLSMSRFCLMWQSILYSIFHIFHTYNSIQLIIAMIKHRQIFAVFRETVQFFL